MDLKSDGDFRSTDELHRFYLSDTNRLPRIINLSTFFTTQTNLTKR